MLPDACPALRQGFLRHNRRKVTNLGALSAIFLLKNRRKAEFCRRRRTIARTSRALERRDDVKLVNAARLPAQKVNFVFAIVKAMGRESLGIIKTAEICSVKISTEIMEFFTIKHLAKIISEQIFTRLLIIFTVI